MRHDQPPFTGGETIRGRNFVSGFGPTDRQQFRPPLPGPKKVRPVGHFVRERLKNGSALLC